MVGDFLKKRSVGFADMIQLPHLEEKHLLDKSDAEGLMHQIASKFTLLESRLSSQSSLNDRVAKSAIVVPAVVDAMIVAQ
jgi:hypothetical protein